MSAKTLTFDRVTGLIWGNECEEYDGFMLFICARVGVPSTLIISTNWSIPLLPGKNTEPCKSSPRIQPVDQRSTGESYQ